MQYTQLKQVIDIDDQITNLHQELSNLYAKRALFVGTTELSGLTNTLNVAIPQKKANGLNDPWVIQTYSYLASAWMVHGIAIPTITELNHKLLRARKIIDTIAKTDITLGSRMGILLIPPTNLLPFPVIDKIRRKQTHVFLDDYINSDLLVTGKTHKKTWQILVAHMGPTGIDLGSAASILKHKKYIFEGYDTRALGLRQYVALTLQINQVIDQDVWTLLLGEKLTSTMLVPSATFLNGQYRFELDESNSILGEERFRPAIEVKG